MVFISMTPKNKCHIVKISYVYQVVRSGRHSIFTCRQQILYSRGACTSWQLAVNRTTISCNCHYTVNSLRLYARLTHALPIRFAINNLYLAKILYSIKCQLCQGLKPFRDCISSTSPDHHSHDLPIQHAHVEMILSSFIALFFLSDPYW